MEGCVEPAQDMLPLPKWAKWCRILDVIGYLEVFQLISRITTTSIMRPRPASRAAASLWTLETLWTLLTLLTLSTLLTLLTMSRVSTVWTMSAVSTVSTMTIGRYLVAIWSLFLILVAIWSLFGGFGTNSLTKKVSMIGHLTHSVLLGTRST